MVSSTPHRWAMPTSKQFQNMGTVQKNIGYFTTVISRVVVL
jgi:hypothetical protein